MGVRILGTAGITHKGANPRFVVVTVPQLVAVTLSVDVEARNCASKEQRTPRCNWPCVAALTSCTQRQAGRAVGPRSGLPLVVKAHVLSDGRGKTGGLRLVHDPHHL